MSTAVCSAERPHTRGVSRTHAPWRNPRIQLVWQSDWDAFPDGGFGSLLVCLFFRAVSVMPLSGWAPRAGMGEADSSIGSNRSHDATGPPRRCNKRGSLVLMASGPHSLSTLPPPAFVRRRSYFFPAYETRATLTGIETRENFEELRGVYYYYWYFFFFFGVSRYQSLSFFSPLSVCRPRIDL